MSDLKPCPFCGGEPEMMQSEPSTARFNEGAVHYGVACLGLSCGVMPYPKCWQMSSEDAAAAWNAERVNHNEVIAMLRVLTRHVNNVTQFKNLLSYNIDHECRIKNAMGDLDQVYCKAIKLLAKQGKGE